MTRYVALFGSINVGANRLKMADLRYAFEREEFEDVETVVASGNVLFSFDERPTDGLEDLFRHMMRERFDIDSFVAVRSCEELREGVEGNPFHADGAAEQVHTHFLSGEPGQDRFDAMVAAYQGRGAERLALGKRALFVDYVEGMGRSRLTGDFITRRLGCQGTARNLRSLQRIIDKMA
ncbi:hypothetical protein NS277_04445 [Novosphingobium barchaimii]|nr:hypothetical protein NS277_04445 [Novosphingobium barchaimii]